MESIKERFSVELGSNTNSSTSLFQKRNSSELVRRQLYKTKMCAFYNVGKCTRGNLCAFAHSVQELRPLPDLRFTRLCELTKRGDVCRDVNCTFAHSLSDLRTTEIPPAPLNEIGALKTTENSTIIKKISSPNELKCKFRNNSIKDPFANKQGDDIFLSSTDTTPHNISLSLRDPNYERIFQWKNFGIYGSQNIKNNSGVFPYLDIQESSHLENNWAYEDFDTTFSRDLSKISPETPCKFISQGEFQEPPNYFSSKCHLTKNVSEWGMANNRDKVPLLHYDILNFFGNDGSHKYQRDIASIEKGTLHIIN